MDACIPTIIKRTGVILAIFLLGFLVCEFALRYYFRAAPFEEPIVIPSHLTDRDQQLRWRYFATDGRNSLGLPNREIGPKKPGVFRILFLGDSLTAWGETSSGALWTEVIEDRLNARWGNSQRSFEVINAGVPGYTTYQELEFLKIYGMDMQPDLVVLDFVFNDLYNKYFLRPVGSNRLATEPAVWLNWIDPDSLPGAWFAGSYAANMFCLASEIAARTLTNRPVFPFELKGDFYTAWKSHAWTQERPLLEEIQQRVDQGGARFAMTVFPVSYQFEDRALTQDREFVLYPQRQITQFADAGHIPSMDLTDAIQERGGVKLYRDYVHLNQAGNDLVVRELESFFAKNPRLLDTSTVLSK